MSPTRVEVGNYYVYAMHWLIWSFSTGRIHAATTVHTSVYSMPCSRSIPLDLNLTSTMHRVLALQPTRVSTNPQERDEVISFWTWSSNSFRQILIQSRGSRSVITWLRYLTQYWNNNFSYVAHCYSYPSSCGTKKKTSRSRQHHASSRVSSQLLDTCSYRWGAPPSVHTSGLRPRDQNSNGKVMAETHG